MNNCELLWNELPPNNNNNNNGFNGQLLSIEPSFSMIEQIVDHETNNDQQQQQQHSNLCNLIETIDTFSYYQQEKTLNGNPLRQLCNKNRATITSNQWPSIFLVNVTVLLTSVDPLRAFIYNLDHIVQSNLIRQRIMARLTHANIILSVSNRLINLNRMNSDTSINNRINRFSFIQFTLSINNDEMEKEKENLFNRIEILDMRTIPIESIDYKLFNETINLILSSSTQSIETYIGTQVQRLLDRDELGLVGVNCHQSHLACLSIDDMKFIAHTSIQAASMKHFQLLYPVLAPDGSIYHLSELFDDLLIHMNRKIGRTHSQQDDEDNEIEIDIKSNEAIDYRTERLHSILSMIDFIQTPPLSTSTTTTTASSKSNSNCSTNIEKLSQLSHLTIKRPITFQLEPPFISDHFHYSSKSLVNYESLVLSIELAVSHCDVWIKIDDQILFQSGILNFTLGIGENTIIVSLVNGVKLLSTYTLTVYRQSREEQYSTKIRIGGRHEICSLTQDCSMVIYPNIPCGLQSTGTMVENDEIISSKWIQSLNPSSRKCTNGIEPGQWMLPCLDCSNESTCKWDRLQWIPYNCSYELINSDQTLSQCFHHKHILMIGDSTNRGILHYLIERMNHTLTDCDKTHDIKRYEIRSNDDGTLQTTFTFAYYPKFWLSTPNRPSFTEMLRKLLLISRREPLMSDGNDYGQNMIAIIGGVQWINRKHLFIISDEFRKFGLTKSKIFIKSYGSGFHQSVNGVHYVPLSEQRKLSQYNQQLIEQATQFKMNVVDTFNKTIALYRDFYPGKCACHFHNIVRNETLVDNHQTEHHYHQKYNYHVDGRLNRLYSEILLSLICK
ncbi:hypothetical protein RDWZM_010571 [Blomia tropicalis]|uniref:NXPE C-terminal domain-containing protein n=1 Tax=Blomia tropicalis TaxID=40697 RepID=A0A9Q0RK86_BLOTA|nr:hypothetical protein RDWZM_010571 [Blomia tropicalis]